MPPPTHPGALRASPLLVCLVLTACSGAASTGPTSPAPSPSPHSAAPGVSTLPVTPAPSAATTLAGCAPARTLASLHAVHHFSVSPDDITVDAAGRLWVTAREAGLLIGMSVSGDQVTMQTVSGGPEGVVADGSSLYVAQQDRNAVVVVGPPSRTLLALPNNTRNLGIDGLGIDGSGHRLLVPDSPTGQLLGVALTGAGGTQLLASGLGRPVAAVMDPAGDIVVASESNPGLVVVSPTGARRTLGHLADLDEVVWFGGLLYVTELGRHDVVAVDPATGAAKAIAVGLPAPQGLAVTAAGVLEIVDATTDTLYAVPACGAAA